MNIRPAEARDLEACVLIDPSYETEYVWQMETSRQSNVINLGFRVTRLPRAMRVHSSVAREMLQEHFERGECFLVADDNGAVRGYLDMITDPWKQLGWIQSVVVAPDRRRKGIGSALTRQAVMWAHDRGLSAIMADMPTKDNPGAAMLQKLGFSFCGYNDHYYSSRDIAIFFAIGIK